MYAQIFMMHMKYTKLLNKCSFIHSHTLFSKVRIRKGRLKMSSFPDQSRLELDKNPRIIRRKSVTARPEDLYRRKERKNWKYII